VKRILPALVAVGLLVWAATGVFTVESGEVAVVWRFGAPTRTLGAGLGMRLPWPVESHTTVAVSESRRVEPGSTRMLTGDTNLVDLDLIVQYTVKDPQQWLLSTAEPERVAADTVLAAATDAVRATDVDSLLTTGRTALQQRLAEVGQARLDALESGIQIEAVEVRELAPPPAVVDAFNDVSSARGDKETLALAAEAYVSSVLPEARGTGARLREQARADAARRVGRAQGEVARFEVVLAAHRASPQATLERLRADALRRIASQARIETAPRGALLSLEQLRPDLSGPPEPPAEAR
jgi:membrane protease subunit HflK